jgi:hypothetical protein
MTEPGWITIHQFPADSEILATWNRKPAVGRAGRAIVSGVDARFTTYDTLEFWRSVLTGPEGVTPAVRVKLGDYYTSLLGTADRGLLTVINTTGRTGPGKLELNNGPTLTLELGPTEARTLPVGLMLDGEDLAYATSEIVRSADRKAYELHGHPGTRGRLAFRRPVTVHLNGRPKTAKARDGLFVVDYRHPVKPLALKIPGGESGSGS